MDSSNPREVRAAIAEAGSKAVELTSRPAMRLHLDELALGEPRQRERLKLAFEAGVQAGLLHAAGVNPSLMFAEDLAAECLPEGLDNSDGARS